MDPVAVYRRTIHASAERIWENVLDWEHLPWLHGSSFLGIEPLEGEADGWRAWVTQPPAERPRRSLIAVELHRPELHYWTRTLEGAGAGGAIRTTLQPIAARATAITVEFYVPGVPAERIAAVGQAYTRLYTRLWDEDEAMMMRRQEVLDARGRGATAPLERIDLGPLARLRARLPLLVDTPEGRVRLIALGDDIAVHACVCPHLGGPLEQGPLCDGVVTCPWHGYRFEVRTGASADGRRLRLPQSFRLEVDANGGAALVPAGSTPSPAKRERDGEGTISRPLR